MLVVIFRATIRQFDDEYYQVAERLRILALEEFGCLEFRAFAEGKNEVALSYWPDEDSIRKWKMHPEHIQAQQKGREYWYESYSVQIATITREYHE